MNEGELLVAIKSHPVTAKHFYGIYARDELSKVHLPVDGFVIINIDKRKENGSHWVLFSRNRNHTVYFDSFGLPPLFPEFYKFADGTFIYNKRQLQDETSSLCGMYCLYFALQLSLGETIENIRLRFSIQTRLNDKIICTLFKKYFTYIPLSLGLTCHALCTPSY